MANVSSSNGIEKYPKLRFKGFSEPWIATRFGNIVDEYSDRTREEDEDILLSAAIEGMFLNSELFDHQRGASNKGYKKINMGTLVLSTQNLHLGNANVNLRFEHGMVSPAYKTYRIHDCSIELISEWVKSEKAKRFFYDATTVGASVCRRNVEWDTLYDQHLYLPSLTEQEHLASFLSTLSLRIKKQTELVERLKKYKRGALQCVFHSMTDCSVITVGDVFIKANKRNSDGRIKNVITNSAEYGLIPQRDFFDKDIAVDGNTNNYYIIHKDCFVYNPRKSNTAPYGPFNCYNGEEEGIISPLYTCLIKKIEVDSTYLSWYFKSDSWYRYIYDNGSQGVRHDRVSMTDDLLMGIPVKLPSAQKQKEISKFLNGIDAKLRLEADILKHLIKIKNGLYDKMFL